MKNILEEVVEERKKQNEKWGVQNLNPIEWVGVLTEEVGEVAKEAVDFYFQNGIDKLKHGEQYDIQDKRLKNYRKECIQVAAVAVQMIECLDRHLKA